MTIERRSAYSGSPWEKKVAYCRAKRAGSFIAVSGTVAVDDGGVAVAPGDAYTQTIFALRRIERALGELGAGLGDVVRTRCFLTDLALFDDFARAHAEVFTGIDPAASCLVITSLVSPEFVVEIEADAVVGDGAQGRCP